MVDQNLLDFVKANAKQLFGNQFWEARFLYKVDVGSKPEKAERRILVLSKFRLFFISGKHTAKLHIETSYPLLSVTEITLYNNPNELYLTVDGRRLYIRLIDDSTVSAQDFSVQLLTAFKHYYPDCDLHRFIELSPSSLYATYAQLPSAKPSLPCNGFRRTYASLCDFYKQSFRDEIVWDVEKIYSLHNNTVLRLDDFSHLSSKDLIPLITTLQFSAWFSGISSETIKLSNEIVDAILLVLKKSQRIKELILKNSGLKNEFLLSAAQALAFNSTIPLMTLDLSGNTFDDHKIVSQFANSLSALTSALRHVNFDGCGLNVKAVNALCDKLQVNQNRSSAGGEQLRKFQLTSISFAENLLKDEISELCHLVCHSTLLTSINLSGTGLPLDKIWISLKSCCSTLTTLKLSGCTFACRKTAKDLNLLTSVKDFFSSAAALKIVDFSECLLPAEILKYILLGLVCNQECDDVSLDLSRSFHDRQCISHLETCAPDLSSVSQLILRDCALEQDAVTLLPSIALMKKLRRLDIGGQNFVQSKKQQQTKQLKCILMEMVKLISEENSTLLELNLSDCRIGMSMCILLNALGVAPSLKMLDISGNDIGNFGARLLGKALQVNSSLEILHMDRNQITHEGYADIVHSLKHNSSLLSVPYPVHDASESLKLCKDKTENVLTELDSMLRRNNSQQGFNNCVEASSWIYETHSKLVLGNVEEELNQIASKTTRLLNEWMYEDNSDVILAQKLLHDVESVKDMLDQLLSLADSGEFITRHLDGASKSMSREISENLTTSVSSFLHFTSTQNYACTQNPEFVHNVRLGCMQKINELNVETAVQDFGKALRQRYSSIQFNLASSVNEKVCQELIKALNNVNKILGKAKKSSLNSLNNEKPGPTATAATSTTPSGKKKFKFFSKRPLSIIEGHGVPNFAELVDEHGSDEYRERNCTLDGSTDNFDSNSVELINKEELNDFATSGGDVPALVHVQKGRARPPRGQKAKSMHPSNNNGKSLMTGCGHQHALDEGIDQFFGRNELTESMHRNNFDTRAKRPVEDFNLKIELTGNNNDTESGKRSSRNIGVPFFSPGVLEELGAKVSPSPRLETQNLCGSADGNGGPDTTNSVPATGWKSVSNSGIGGTTGTAVASVPSPIYPKLQSSPIRHNHQSPPGVASIAESAGGHVTSVECAAPPTVVGGQSPTKRRSFTEQNSCSASGTETTSSASASAPQSKIPESASTYSDSAQTETTNNDPHKFSANAPPSSSSTPVSRSACSAVSTSAEYLTSKASAESSPTSNNEIQQTAPKTENSSEVGVLIIRRKSINVDPVSPNVAENRFPAANNHNNNNKLEKFVVVTAAEPESPQSSLLSSRSVPSSVATAVQQAMGEPAGNKRVNLLLINNSNNNSPTSPPNAHFGGGDVIITAQLIHHSVLTTTTTTTTVTEPVSSGSVSARNDPQSNGITASPTDSTVSVEEQTKSKGSPNKPERPPLPSRPPPVRPFHRVWEQNKDKDEAAAVSKVVLREKSDQFNSANSADHRKSVLEMKKVFESSKSAGGTASSANTSSATPGSHASLYPMMSSSTAAVAPDRPVPPPRVRCGGGNKAPNE